MSSVYLHVNGNDNFLTDYVKEIKIDDTAITLTDVMGKQTVVTGVIKNIDLVKNVILIEQK